MNFTIKKTISALSLPIPLILILLIIGICILYVNHNAWLGKLLVVIAAVILIVFTTPWIPNLMLHNLEKEYPPLTIAPKTVIDIVVLGAGNGGYSNYPANDQLSSASLSRLVEGIRLHEQIKDSKLILSGGRIFGSPPDSKIMNNVATMLGVKPENILMEAGSRDTYQEAINLKKILGTKPFILVTSAYHMPRAMALFQHQGMHPIAAPTQLLLGKKRFTVKNYLPNSIYLLYSDIAFHEYLGVLWNKLSGKT